MKSIITIPSAASGEAASNIEGACPVCRSHAPVAVVKKSHEYRSCPACACVFTPKLVVETIRTENNAGSGRHDKDQDLIRLKRLSGKLGRHPEQVIDFGCGQGETTRFFQSQGINTVGIDQETQVQLNHLEDGSVDGIIMIEVIEHLFDPHPIFREFNRVLKAGGVVYLESSFADGKNLAEWNEYLDPAIGHCTVHTLKSMSVLALKNGFVVDWVNGNSCFLTKVVSARPRKDQPQPETQQTVEIIGEGISEPLVSLVISAYKSEKFMRACLTNLTRQTIFNQCEVIVVDSGSPEDERSIILEFQEKHPNIRYVRTVREKVAEAWNRGLALARGRYFASLSADDSIRDDGLAIMAAALERHADCAFVYGDVGWTTQPNDTFPCKNLMRTVKYPDYAPVESLFYCLTGCVQFFRTTSLREVGGFEPLLYCAADFEVILKMVMARMNGVHVPEVLTLFFQNTQGVTQSSNRSALEHQFITECFRGQLDISGIFQVEPGVPASAASAFTALGIHTQRISVPWEDRPFQHFDFAFACLERALELDPQNEPAGMALVMLHQKLERLNPNEKALVARWPKMREWIARFRQGEGFQPPPVRHALLGPVYRPGEWASRPTPAQLAQEPQALRPWITRIEGRHVYLSEDIFPRPSGLRYQPQELQAGAKQLAALVAALPSFYAHFGGAGDALLLMASFYDQKPDAVVFSYPNGTGAARALFDAFPKLSKIYFLPQHAEAFFHIVLRSFIYEARNCLGAGATPKDNYDEEWKASLDITKKYGIHKAPRWAAEWRQNENSKRVAIAPKGSLSGMVGSKRNIILPELWPQVVAHILERGFEPVILGVPSEAKEYPALPGCVDMRGESFSGQMKLIGQSAGLVGADSWAKTFSALAQVPTLVFEPLKGADLVTWKDASDWVFIEPWPAIKMIRTLEDFRRFFDARIAKIPGSEPVMNHRPAITWEGSYLDFGSLSHVNRELSSRLSTTLNLTRVGPAVLSNGAKSDPAMEQYAKQLAAKSPAGTAVTVRHQWPPNWSKPAEAALVVIQPWEFGVLPEAWVKASSNVDEFWVPSPQVRAMYLNSGVAAEKVRVMPNGVDTRKFRPGLKPMRLNTKKKFKFLFVGGTIFRKGPDILLDVFTRTFSAKDDVCLVIKDFGGDSFYQGQTAEAAIRAIQQKPETPEILYLKEELSSADMPSLYAACDCFVLPYRGEGFGMPVLEAMACGLPVIVTARGATDSFVSPEAGWKIPSMGIQLGDHIGNLKLVKKGWLLEPVKQHLAAIMKYASTHVDECKLRGARGRGVVERKFDWDDIAAAAAHRLLEIAALVPVKPAAASTMAKGVSARPQVLPDVAHVGRLDEARELFAQKDFEGAWAETSTAIAKRPFHPEAFLLLAEISLAAGDEKSAKHCAQRARDLAPGWMPAKQFLARSLKGNAKLNWLDISHIKHHAPRLSVCLIVKNEEQFLAQCLKSVRGLASQIVVVDTGSTDRTVEIAREFGAEIYSFTWCDDFAAARNAALEHATGDWVLMLDADEEFPAVQHAKLLADIKSDKTIAFRLPLVNAGQENEGRSFVPRLFRNAPHAYFTGRIHEQIFASLLESARKWGLNTGLGSAELLHHGYAREMVHDRNKVERNLKLLRAAVEENPSDINLVMNFGLELVRSDDLSAGIEKYREAYDLMTAQPATERVPELREVLLTQFTSHLYKVRNFEEIIAILTSPVASHGGLTASLHFALGLAHFELKQFSEAADQMRQCLAKRKQSCLTPINTDIHTAAPQHCLALCLVRLGDKSGAEKAFAAALAEGGPAEAAKLDYARFLQNEGRAVDALNQLHGIVAVNSRNTAAWQLGGEIALSHPEFLEFALDWTFEAFKALPENPLIASQRAETLMLNGKVSEAAKLWEMIWSSEHDARILAALILCEVAAGLVPHTPNSSVDEVEASRSFVEWYQRLIAARANALAGLINGRLEPLSRALPSAAEMLRNALSEAAEPAAA